MIVTLRQGADADTVRKELVARGLWVSPLSDGARVAHFVVSPASTAVSAAELSGIEGVASVAAPPSPHPRITAQGPVVDVRGVAVGAPGKTVFMCGPCAVESEERIFALAAKVSAAGAQMLRGGAYKPRTSPYAFQGHGEVALRWMRRAADAHGLKVVTEALGEGDVSLVAEYADLVQVGSRNMQNFALLKAIGRAGRPVLLKRAMAATVEEWLLAGEYLLASGAPGVIFCERGIRGFDPSTRNLLDLGSVALLAHVYKLPVVVDPSHATGRRDLVLPLARAAVGAGAAGVMIEVHDDPGCALSDGPQALPPNELRGALDGLRAMARSV
ncbi:MAG: 3-deoxy-7-phosphoheptulonate synthase [Polyangiales bacterium]